MRKARSIYIPPHIQCCIVRHNYPTKYICYLHNDVFFWTFGIETGMVLRVNDELNEIEITYATVTAYNNIKNRFIEVFTKMWQIYARITFTFIGRTFRIKFSRRKKKLRFNFALAYKPRLYYKNMITRRRRKSLKYKYNQKLKNPSYNNVKTLVKTMMNIRPVSRQTGKGMFYSPRIHKKYKQKKNKAVFHRVADLIGAWGRGMGGPKQVKEETGPVREYFNTPLL